MTQVGIAYLSALETMKHNREMEAINLREADIKAQTLDETVRHNIASEDISRREAATKAAAQKLAEQSLYLVDIPSAQSSISLRGEQAYTENYKRKQLSSQSKVNIQQAEKVRAETTQSKATTNKVKAETTAAKAKAKESTGKGTYYTAKSIETVVNTAAKIAEFGSKVAGVIAKVLV